MTLTYIRTAFVLNYSINGTPAFIARVPALTPLGRYAH
jgi:hypothetical protein